MKKLITVLFIVLAAWNLWLTDRLLRRDPSSPEAIPRDDGITYVNNTVNGYTTDVTNMADAAQEKLVVVTSYMGTERTRSISGIIYESRPGECDILTNARIIENEVSLSVRFDNGIELDAEVIGSDPKADLALLRTHPDFMADPVRLTDSDRIKPGEYVIAIGGRHPETRHSTVSFGVVSEPGQMLRTRDDTSGPWLLNVVESDVALNQTNTGGPLLNLSGEMTALLSSALSSAANSTGMAYGTAANEIRLIASQLKEYGEVRRGYLGVSGMNVSDMEVYLKSAMDLNLDQTDGIYISYVATASPAETAGIQEGDVLVAVDGEQIENGAQLTELLYTHQPEDVLSVQVIRKGEDVTLNPVLE